MRWLKWIGGGIVGLVAVGAVAAGGGWWWVSTAADARLARTWPAEIGDDLPIPWPLDAAEIEALRAEKLAALGPVPEGVPVPDVLAGVDLEAIATERAFARGKALIDGRMPCGECHGKDGAGKLVADAQPVWTWYAPNITSAGAAAGYTGRDWDRIVRHGITKAGTTATMPAVDFVQLSDREVSDVAVYYRGVDPVSAPQPATVVGPVGTVLLGSGKLPLSAESIDHGATHLAVPPAEAVDLAFGGHVVSGCVGCHRTDYSGGPIAQGPPDWPAAANLTPTGLAGWTEADFVKALREGVRPDGAPLKEPMSAVTRMPMTDTELKAMFLFLSSVPAKPTGS